jgi:hypothetical protein
MMYRWSWRKIIPQRASNENLRQNPRQLSPLRSGPRWPAIHAMLWGSTAINTGARWRKISSRQSTRTRARQARSSTTSRRPACAAASCTQRPTMARLGTAPRGNTMANNVTIWLRLKPMAQPEPAKLRCLASLNSSASDHACHSAAFSALSRSFSCHRASSLIPPACALATACTTRWACV